MGIFSDILLTVDFDRTLTAPDGTIPQRNMEAIRYFMQGGGAFTVNTGRSLPMSHCFKDIVPVNAPLLLYNGSAAYDLERQEFLFLHTIDLDMTRTIAEVEAMFPDLTVEVQGQEAHYCFHENHPWAALSDAQQCPHRFVKPGEDLGPFLKFTLFGTIKDSTVASLFEGTPQEQARMDQAQQLLQQRFGDRAVIFRSGMRVIDVHAKGVSKLRSARQLQRQLGRKILVCVGDGENDLAMLQGADYAFSPADGVVANLFPNVCNCADGAVADVIYEKTPEILSLEA